MSDIWAIFNAGRVRRWHTHPVMADHDDRLDAHQGRVARLAMALFPDDHPLLKAALRHDDGESAGVDVPNPVKNRLPRIARDALNDVEDAAMQKIWRGSDFPEFDYTRLRVCDKLDAIMWVSHKAPHLLKEDGWVKDRAEVVDLAYKCGVGDQVKAVVIECLRQASIRATIGNSP